MLELGALFLGWSLLLTESQAANILAVQPFPIYSHFHAYLPIFKELARRGHNVTVLSPFPLPEPMDNYNDIVIPNTMAEIMSGLGVKDVKEMNGILWDICGIFLMCPAFLEPVLRLPQVKDIIEKDSTHFDLLILEAFFCQEPFIALGDKYRAPVAVVHPVFMNLIIAEYSGNVLPMSFMPHYKVRATDRMDFGEKVRSAIYYLGEYLAYHFYFKAGLEKYMRDYFKYPGAERLPGLDDLLSRISLLLLDNHVSLSYPKPFLPNVVEIGGLSLKEPTPMPQDLEAYMNNSKDGVVFFSWGSHYESRNMKPEVLSKVLSVFSKLEQRVLFKWENETLEGKPDNVRTAAWFPQPSILGHPNLRVFISHCGIHGLTEAVHHGVPILGTPLFADQHQNAKIAEKAGFGIPVDIDSVTEQELLVALNKLIHEPSYKEAAVRQSRIFKDRPLSALDSAVYWLEYVIRHSGAKHLRPATSDPNWNQLLLVLCPLFVSVLAAVLLPLLCLRCLLSKGTQRDAKKKEKKQ